MNIIYTKRQLMQAPLNVFLILAMFFLVLTSESNAASSIEDTPYNKALELYTTIAREETDSLQKWEQNIRSLPYTSLMIFRALCTLPNITVPELHSTVLRLQKSTVRYETAALLEYYCTQPGADATSAWHFLEKLEDTSFVTRSVLASLVNVSVPSAPLLFRIIDQVQQLKEEGKWAAKALFEIESISYAGLSSGLNILPTLTASQNWAAERLCQITEMEESKILEGLKKMHKLSFDNSWNSRSLFLAPTITPEAALLWLTEFFILPDKDEENLFVRLPKQKKTELLAAYVGGSEKLIWHTNNLHDVTNDYGQEIGGGRLRKFSYTQLLNLFRKLDKKSQSIYQQKIDQAVAARDKGATINILRLATQRARKESARNLTSSNIYILLAQGNDLYDSSFRDILVPVLQKRMAASFQNDLLRFLLSTDPDNSYSSNFITNLAQKGKLTQFLPKELDKQKEIIDLVARSAFQDQNSLILFSATFTKLLRLVDPEVRTHLINIMLNAIDKDAPVLSSQLQVILQHYVDQHKDLLSPGDRVDISTMIQQRGKINIEAYRQTPFAEWLGDKALQSLSVFQRDDDGISSYFSYCRNLIRKGYQPSLSKYYKLAESVPGKKKELDAVLKALKREPKNNLNLLFRISIKMSIVIDWKKNLNGTEISHSIFVYRDKAIQQKLIAQFLASGQEMFAQRGHSYWRYEQLIAPFEALWETGALDSAEIWEKQRFLSIGSCGGIKAYRQLNALFRNQVDILATVGTGKSSINNPYNIALLEIIATGRQKLTWDDVSEKTATIFSEHQGGEYLRPGSLPAILHKMTYTETDQDGTH